MGNVRFELNHKGVTELLKSDELAVQLDERVARIADTVRAIAPVVTGEYKGNVASGTFDDGDRNTGYVHVGVPYAASVEVQDRTLGTALGMNE